MVPIELSGWTLIAAYIFLALMVLEIAVRVWQVLQMRKRDVKLEEIADKQQEVVAKVNIMFLALKMKPQSEETAKTHNAEITDEFEKVEDD